MNNHHKTRETLETEINSIQENGIQADRINLKRNMHTQFADPFEFAREYVVNSFDALATECHISGRETEDTVTIVIKDNGKGMNIQRLEDYFKIFRSRKDYRGKNSIGRFGVGKMSVAALPGLLFFSGITSDGTECWRFETDSLIDDHPVRLERIDPVAPMGTKFEITIKKTTTLSDLLSKIYEILYKYVRYLGIDVFFDLTDLDEEHNPVRKKLTKGNWEFNPKCMGREYRTFINGIPVDVVIGIGNHEHELYQSKVFITSKYNLLSYGSEEEIVVPNLMIRINSEIFELTFGRHCLSNDDILVRLVEEIRCNLLPQYFNHILHSYNEDFILKSPEMAEKIEELVIGLLAMNPNNHSWSTFPVFNIYGSGRISFLELNEDILRKGLVYIEASGSEGTDYSMFNAPVLKKQQPEQALELVQKIFGPKVIDLDRTDTVIEMQDNKGLVFSPEEKEFEKQLVFQYGQEVIERILGIENMNNSHSCANNQIKDQLEKSMGICEEARIVERDICSLLWRVGYLVERDGKTPCYSRKFLVRDKKIILNLFHPEIRQFIELSSFNAKLSAHWAMAMCLSDTKLLAYITPDAREDILLIDAMSRLSAAGEFIENRGLQSTNKPFLDFIRNCRNKDGKNNFQS